MTPEKHPAPVERAEVVKSTPPTAVPDEALIRQYIDQGVATYEQDPEAIQRAIILRVLAAETLEDILAPTAVESAQDLLDEPLEFHTFHLNRSDFENGLTIYAVVEAKVIADGRRTTFSTGAGKIVAQLMRAQERGFLPFEGVIVEEGRDKPGRRRPMSIHPLGRRDRVARSIEEAGGEVKEPAGSHSG